MKKVFITSLFLLFQIFYTSAQTKNVVLLEEFTETGCGACSEYDSSFQALVKANSDKVALINYHCFYQLDTFYTYNKACDVRYGEYKLSGYPSGMANGKMPGKESSHLTYINQSLIDKLYGETPRFKIDITTAPTGSGNVHSTSIKVKTTALQDYPGKDLKLFVAITENNIDHEKRYKTKAVNGLNEFNHILRAFVPSANGIALGPQKKGKGKQVKLSFTNDDKEVDFKETQVVVYIQDTVTKEVFGTAVTKGSPFK